jgi:hypothetical protein
MQYLRTDQYTYVGSNCPVRSDVHPADDFVEVTFGEYRFGGDTLRLIFNDPETLLRITETLNDARAKLIGHLYGKAHPDSALSQLG